MQKRIEKYFFLSVQQMVSLEETNDYIKQLFFSTYSETSNNECFFFLNLLTT